MSNLKKYRKRAGVTQEKLAELCGTYPCYIGQIENGRRFPSISYIEQLAFALQVAPHLLFFDENFQNDSKVPVFGLNSTTKEELKNELIQKVSADINEIFRNRS